MRNAFLLGVTFLFAIAGCSDSAPAEPPGDVFEGKNLRDWGNELKAADAETRRAAAQALTRMAKQGLNARRAIPKLQNALQNEDPATRHWSAVAIVYAARGTPMPVQNIVSPTLKEAAKDGDEEVRTEAAALLKAMGPPRTPGGPPANPEAADGEKKNEPAKDDNADR